jgi:hypothetical protein
MKKPYRPDDLLIDALVPEEYRKDDSLTRAEYLRALKRRNIEKQKKIDAQWIPHPVMFTRKHLEVLEGLEVGKERLGIHDKPTMIIRALVEALAMSDVDVSACTSKTELRDTLLYFLNHGVIRDTEYLMSSLTGNLYDRLLVHAKEARTTVEDIVERGLERYLAYVNTPANYFRLPGLKPRRRSSRISRALKIGDRWWRNDVGRWELVYDANTCLFKSNAECAINACGWETIRRQIQVKLDNTYIVLHMRFQVLFQKYGRKLLAQPDNMMRDPNLRLRGPHAIVGKPRSIEKSLRVFEQLPAWDDQLVLRYLWPETGEVTVRFPGMTSYPKAYQHAVEGGTEHQNEIMRYLSRQGVIVLRLEYTPPITIQKGVNLRLDRAAKHKAVADKSKARQKARQPERLRELAKYDEG